ARRSREPALQSAQDKHRIRGVSNTRSRLQRVKVTPVRLAGHATISANRPSSVPAPARIDGDAGPSACRGPAMVSSLGLGLALERSPGQLEPPWFRLVRP